MRGAHQGKRYGRIISFLYGVLVSAMFPLGTYLAFYTFSRLGTNWEGGKHQLNGRESYWETSERLSISSLICICFSGLFLWSFLITKNVNFYHFNLHALIFELLIEPAAITSLAYCILSLQLLLLVGLPQIILFLSIVRLKAISKQYRIGLIGVLLLILALLTCLTAKYLSPFKSIFNAPLDLQIFEPGFTWGFYLKIVVVQTGILIFSSVRMEAETISQFKLMRSITWGISAIAALLGVLRGIDLLPL